MSPSRIGHLPRSGHCSVVVDAPVDAVWAVIADPTRVGEWSHETQSAAWLRPATGPAVGAVFAGRNRAGRSRWTRRSEVVELDEASRVIRWRTVPSPIYRDSTLWTMRVEPDDGGARITQEFEVLKLSAFFDRLFYALIPQHRDRSDALRGDLVRIGDVARQRSGSWA